jgi:hypothetical protein
MTGQNETTMQLTQTLKSSLKIYTAKIDRTTRRSCQMYDQNRVVTSSLINLGDKKDRHRYRTFEQYKDKV